jgi:hypothetical protein
MSMTSEPETYGPYIISNEGTLSFLGLLLENKTGHNFAVTTKIDRGNRVTVITIA